MPIRFAPAALLALALSTLALAACNEIPQTAETPAQHALDACEDARGHHHDYGCAQPDSVDPYN